MKTLLLVCLSALMLFSCESNNNTTSTKPANQLGGILAPTLRNFTPAELVIGKRICSALKTKREKMESFENLKEKFRFRNEYKSCGSKLTSSVTYDAYISNASPTDLEYEAQTGMAYTYFKDVITDASGAMKIFCDNFSSSDTVSNQILSGGSYISLSVLLKDGYDYFELSKVSRTGNSGNFSLVSTEGISIITQANQADAKFLGVEKMRVRNLTCDNSTDYSSVTQNWVSALTGYPTTSLVE
jgi:hypothetical protein